MESIYEVITPENSPAYIQRTDADGRVWSIPMDESNSDYAAYLESLNDDTETE